jgi:hypothetical protein
MRRWMAIALGGVLALTSVPFSAAPAAAKTPAEQSRFVPAAAPLAVPTSQRVAINEVLPNPTGGSEWVELINASFLEPKAFAPLVARDGQFNPQANSALNANVAATPIATAINGWQVTNEDGLIYTIPNELPPVPFGAFVLIYFDGTGPAGNDYDFSDKTAVLHTPAGLTNIFGDTNGQAAVYAPGALDAANIRSFVAWGLAASSKAGNAEQAGVWDDALVVPAQSNGGEIVDVPTGGLSFGLTPGGDATKPGDWVSYQPADTTPGVANGVPRPNWTPTDDQTKMDASEFAIGWQAVPNATSYQFQMDDNADFSSPEVNVQTTEPYYVPPTNSQTDQVTQATNTGAFGINAVTALPPGRYYWRARSEGALKVFSAWSVSKIIDLIFVVRCAETVLAVPWKLQSSDTSMLNLEGAPETGKWAWDKPNMENGMPVRGDPGGNNNCVRASISMINAYYGGSLSQDRISYYGFVERPGAASAGDGPEGDLGYGSGMSYPTQEDQSLSFALGTTITAIGGKPTFNQIKTWINEGRAIMMRNPGHMMALIGYRECPDGSQWLRINDPWDAPRWQDYSTQNMDGVWPGPAGAGGAPNVRSDEESIWRDSDGDGVIDFDETVRFGTDPNNSDSDGDGVLDKADVREYVFNAAGTYNKRTADFDSDGLRKERDPDNDNDGSNDGCEDSNRNGALNGGESNNFSAASATLCLGARLFVNRAEMDYDIFIQQRNFQIRNSSALGTLNWSIDTSGFPAWLSLMGSNSGSLAPGDATTVLVNVNRTGLAVGNYQHAINVTSNGGSASVLALAEVAPTVSFGAADYDSGWTSVPTDTAQTLTHNLGGNLMSYLVRMEYRTPDVNGVNVRYLGGKDFGAKIDVPGHLPNDRVGAYWRSLTSTSIVVYRRPEDTFAPEVRIRIWRAPAPHFDSGWQPMGLEHARKMAHALRGRGEHYLVDMEYRAPDVNGINARYWGGADFGNRPAPGHVENDRVGAYWRSLGGRYISVFRRAEDSYVPEVRVRLWRMAAAAYDSGWVGLAQDAAQTLNHNLGGNADDYLVDMIYDAGAGSFDGVNARYFGGMDIGSKPTAGHAVDDRTAAYWRTLTNASIVVYRRPEDDYAPQVRVRIWRP